MAIFVAGLFSIAVFMAIFVPFSQRLLGVRFGLIRLALGAALTLTVFSPIANALVGKLPFEGSNAAAVAFLALTAVCSMLAGLVFLVLSEALVPTGSLPRARDLRRDLSGRIARTRRYLQILRIAIRHGLGPYLRGRRRPGRENAAGQAELARSLRLALDEAGVTFVKLGQVLSTRSDIIPASVAERAESPAGPGLPRALARDRVGPHRGARRITTPPVRRLRHRTARRRVGRAGLHRPPA